MGGNVNEFKRHCRSNVINDFINKWYNELNVNQKPLLRTYCLLKFDFGTESYMYNVKDVSYRSAIAKLRASSHILEIELGRYTKPKIPSHLRLCKLWNVEDEAHFTFTNELHLLERIRSIYPDVDSLDKRHIFSCDQAALWMVFSVCPSVCLSVCLSVRHTFLTMFPSSYHHEIFWSYHHGPG